MSNVPSSAHSSHLSSLELHHSTINPLKSASHPSPQLAKVNSPLGTLLVEHPASAVRAGNERILAKGDVAAAVAADVGHDGAAVVTLAAGCAAGHGAGGGGAGGGWDLVLFARHFER